MTDTNLVTSCEFCDQEYVIRMSAEDDNLEILVTDKTTADEWRCSYDAKFVENLTQKTGNFKKFEVFVAMLKSSLLKTSDCVSLELLSYEDLESLRMRKVRSNILTSRTSSLNGQRRKDRRYLILTYSVEFDKIHYPLPLEYCGLPNPAVLQDKVQKLQAELARLRKGNNPAGGGDEGAGDGRKILALQRRVDELTEENLALRDEVKRLNYKARRTSSGETIGNLQKAILRLEKNVLMDERSHHQLVEKMTKEKERLIRELERVRSSEMTLRARLRDKNSSRSVSRENAPKTRSGDRIAAGDDQDAIKTIYPKKIANNTQPPPPRRRCKARSRQLLNNDQRHHHNNINNDQKTAARRSNNTRRSSFSSCSSRSNNATDDEVRSGKTTPRAASRSSSVTSRCSSANGRPKRKVVDSKMNNLKERIASLQKLLDKNARLH